MRSPVLSRGQSSCFFQLFRNQQVKLTATKSRSETRYGGIHLLRSPTPPNYVDGRTQTLKLSPPHPTAAPPTTHPPPPSSIQHPASTKFPPTSQPTKNPPITHLSGPVTHQKYNGIDGTFPEGNNHRRRRKSTRLMSWFPRLR